MGLKAEHVTTVVRTVKVRKDELPDGRETAPALLPTGFPILVREATYELIEPVLVYTYDKYRKRPASALNATNVLKDWWAYLDEHDLQWSAATADDLRYFADVMHLTISPLTRRPYSAATMRKYTGAIRLFYRWAASKKLLGSDAGFDVEAAMGTQCRAQDVEEVELPETRSGIDDEVFALTSREVSELFEALGPLPSDKEPERFCRDRLIAETSLHTGMRRDEISHLTVSQIRSLRPASDDPDGACLLRITWTKGLRPRRVEVPNWLVGELVTYIDSERADSVQAGDRNHNRLFVNGINAKRNVGGPVSNDTINRRFRAAALRAGHVKQIVVIDPETSEQSLAPDARYTFHCMRHTFAIWRYYAEYAAGIHEPWKIVQALLGHKSLATTLEIYLRPTQLFESQVSNVVMQHFDAIRKGRA